MITIYRSTDVGAPTLSGTAGNLINVLDACLVNGYGSKGSLGQTKPYSGTNLAVYRMNVGSGMYLAVDDTGTQGARIRGFHSITAAQSSAMPASAVAQIGSWPFPNEYQIVGGLYMYKSAAASAATRSWSLISNGFIFYLWIDCNSDAGTNSRTLCFGDIAPYNQNDPNPCMLICSETANYYNDFGSVGPVSTVIPDHYFAMKFDGSTRSTTGGKIAVSGAHNCQYGKQGMGISTGYYTFYPDPIAGGMMLTPVVAFECYANSYNVLRGRMPGLQAPCHQMPFSTGDIIVGAAGTSIAGRTFEAFKFCQTRNTWTGVYLIETSDTWNDINFR